MKALTFILLILVGFFFAACKKEKHVLDNTLTGKWRLIESLDDPGNGSGKWLPVPQTPNTGYVEFKSDGKLGGTAFAGYMSYVVKGSVTLTFTSTPNVLQNYRYKIKDGAMYMSPDDPIRCYEACGTSMLRPGN